MAFVATGFAACWLAVPSLAVPAELADCAPALRTESPHTTANTHPAASHSLRDFQRPWSCNVMPIFRKGAVSGHAENRSKLAGLLAAEEIRDPYQGMPSGIPQHSHSRSRLQALPGPQAKPRFERARLQPRRYRRKINSGFSRRSTRTKKQPSESQHCNHPPEKEAMPVPAGSDPRLRKCPCQKHGAILLGRASRTHQKHDILTALQTRFDPGELAFAVNRLLVHFQNQIASA